jgi:hypothetical protein
LEHSDIHNQRDQPHEEIPRPRMEHRHWFGNRLRYAAQVVRAEKARRRNRQQKLL